MVGIGILGGEKLLSAFGEKLLAILTSLPPPNHLGADVSARLAPIIIHTSVPGQSAGSQTRGVFALAFQLTVGAATCWAAYGVCTSMIPDAVKEMLPVNRKLFDRAVKSLGEGIIHVRESLSEQMGLLDEKHDELGQKQDQTLSEVMTVKDELLDARVDLENLQESLTRCESSLSSSKTLQDYTSRGVRLLVRCVATIFPENDRILEELALYIREADGTERVEVASIGAQRNPSLPITPEDEHPALTPINRPLGRQQSALESSRVSSHIQTNDKMDEIHSLLGLVSDGRADSRQYRSPIYMKA